MVAFARSGRFQPFLGLCHPLKGRWKAVQHYTQGAALRCYETFAGPVRSEAKRSVATHPVFRSSGCGTDPHQSPIGFKASADVLASAPGSRGAPENRRYQANVQGLRQQCGYPFGYQACVGSWSGRLSRYAASGMAGDASQSTCWFDANKAAGLVTPAKVSRNIGRGQRVCPPASCNKWHARACVRAPSWPRRVGALTFCDHRNA